MMPIMLEGELMIKDGYIRTTFHLEADLRERIQKEAKIQRRTIKEVFNEFLREGLDRKEKERK